MSKEYWEEIENLKIPSLDELKNIVAQEPGLFFGIDDLNEEYIELSYKYKYVFGKYFLMQTGLDIFDNNLREHECKPSPCLDEQKDFFFKYDSLGLNFFYLRCIAHVERLSAEARIKLEKAFETRDDGSWLEAMMIVYNSFRTVMPVRPDIPNGVFESIETLDHSYRLNGRDIPLAMVSRPNFDENGNLVSKADERNRIVLFSSLKQRVKTAIEKDLGASVGIIIQT